MSSFQNELSQYDYILILLPDVHGIFRSKVHKSSDGHKFTKKIPMVCISTIFGINNEIILEKRCSDYGFGNVGFQADPSRIVPLPWLNGNTGKRHCGVLGSNFWADGQPVFDCRNLALQQIKELASHEGGYEILSSGEYEFRLFTDPKAPHGFTEDVCELQPSHTTLGFSLPIIYHRHRDFIVDMMDSLDKAAVGMDYVFPEYGSGQLETPLNPEYGIRGPDNSAIFKNAMHHIGLNHGRRVTFMTKPIFGETGNGCHFNHSIWKKNKDGSRTNAFYDKNKDNLTEFGRHWIAGILKHAPALSAFCSPTVNCYRRLHTPWAPHEIFWGVDNRHSLLRVKVGGENATYFENRLGSAAANPYLLFASTIAAGLDGVKNKLELPKDGEKSLGLLPSTLSEALDALKKDEVFDKAFGKDFIDAFIQVKTDSELKVLSDVDVSVSNVKHLDLEKKEYFDLA